jgi:zinc transporter 1/2/3
MLTFNTGVFSPILLARYLPTKLNLVLITLKQFGTGIIISTAFIHVCLQAP